jgi:hypothetical membrane protein
MNTKTLLPLGWITSAIFILGTFILGSLLQGYNPVSQTVSEIGQNGSPLYFQWQLFSITIGVLLILFSLSLIFFSKKNKLSIVPGIFMLAQALSQFGVGFFPSPHELHNVFGLSMTIGYFSPLVFALAWKNKLGKRINQLSWLAFILIILGIFLNLSPLFAPTLYPLEYYGIVQRFLLFTFYAYAGYVSVRILKYDVGQ